MSANGHIHVCARCGAEFNSPTAYPPPGWLWRGSHLYCDACVGLVDDPIDDAAPTTHPAEDDRLPDAQIMLASGAILNLTHPDPDLIRIDDIALALSRICRFGNQARRFYSVAEHCVMVSYRVSPGASLAALLHDASEAYLGDVVRPLKAILPAYRRIEAHLEQAIDRAFAIDSGRWRHEIKKADVDMAVIEAHRLMPRDAGFWGTAPDDLTQAVEGWLPEEARRRFLERFRELTAAPARQEAA